MHRIYGHQYVATERSPLDKEEKGLFSEWQDFAHGNIPVKLTHMVSCLLSMVELGYVAVYESV
ncbi:hypothetical protein N0V88_005956 [Collariella sp. IMI 366227]|nr:hypothetical protein N0V88_005956 [Collariella sp. IMI 366227]